MNCISVKKKIYENDESYQTSVFKKMRDNCAEMRSNKPFVFVLIIALSEEVESKNMEFISEKNVILYVI